MVELKLHDRHDPIFWYVPKTLSCRSIERRGEPRHLPALYNNQIGRRTGSAEDLSPAAVHGVLRTDLMNESGSYSFLSLQRILCFMLRVIIQIAFHLGLGNGFPKLPFACLQYIRGGRHV
jgi:hypothetical protein